MTPVHFCFRRVNPALSIDLCSIGTLQGNQFVPLGLDRFDDLRMALSAAGVPDIIHRSDISDDAYVFHKDVAGFISASLSDQVDWFQDALIVVLPLDLDSYESSKEKE